MTKKILVAPLDWGLGHATRCIPIIRYLIEKNIEVTIGADKRPLELLKKEFPSLEFVTIPGYEINYSSNGSMILKMALSIPKILAGIKSEHELLKKIIKEKNIDAVISDNRHGLWSNEVPCIFITHQIMIKSPFAEKLLYKLNIHFIKKYTECWIPDFEGTENLSSDLSHKMSLPGNAFFIGPLSRFRPSFAPLLPRGGDRGGHELLVILSGPEPQRSVFEEKILSQLKLTNYKTLLVRGIPEKREEMQISENIKMVSHLDSEKMQEAIMDSKIIFSRSGYSTIMDLAILDKKAIFIPTPGQTEQEYLAGNLMEKGIAYCVKQNKFNLQKALKESEKYKGFVLIEEIYLLKKYIDIFLRKLE